LIEASIRFSTAPNEDLNNERLSKAASILAREAVAWASVPTENLHL
jgi:hypothetical protein